MFFVAIGRFYLKMGEDFCEKCKQVLDAFLIFNLGLINIPVTVV